MKLNICALLFLHYRPHVNLPVYPVIEIGAYVRRFGHNVTWFIWGEDSRRVQSFDRDGIRVYATPERNFLPANFPLAPILNLIPNTIGRLYYVVKLVKKDRYDLILVTDFVFDGLAAAYMKRRYKIPFVFQLQNPLEQVREEYEIYRPRPLFLYRLAARFFEFAGRWMLKEADLVLPISESLKQELIKQGVPEQKILACPSGVDTALFCDRDGKAVRRRYGLGELPVIVYIGTLIKPRRLDVLVKAFASVVRRRKVKLLVVGSGNDESNLKKLAGELGVAADIVFTGQVPQTDVPDFIAAADVGVVPVAPTSFYKLSSSIKLVEYMAMARPVVANEEIPEQKTVIAASGAGVLVPFTPEDFARAILELLDNPQAAFEMGQRGRRWVVEHRSYEVLARRLEARFRELAGGGKSENRFPDLF